jgi:polyhydroxyalkanoate synthesis regulator phasin
MADKDDVFKRYLEAGLSFFEMTQQRAEAALKDLSGSGESAKGQAQKAVEWVKERGRQGTDELRDLVRNEIRSQLDSLGLATRDDLARLEDRLAAVENAASVSGGAAGAPAVGEEPAVKKGTGSSKAAGVTKAATTRKAAPKAADARVPAMKKAAPPPAKAAAPPGPRRAPGAGAAPDLEG